MPFNGNGSFTPLPPPDYPAVAGTSIIADYFNNVMQDVFDGLSNTLTRDGQSPAQANLPMGGFKFTGAGKATATGQFLTWGQTSANLGTLSVTGDLGVGTSPGYRFHIFEPDTVTASAVIRAIAGQASRWIITANAGDPSSQGFHLAQNADRSAGVFNAANAPIDFSTNSTVRARITAAGRVGIATNAPTELLDVNGNAVIRGLLTIPSSPGYALKADNVFRSTTGLQGGAFCPISSNVTIGDASAYMNANGAQWSIIYNDSASAVTISPGGGVTLRLAGTTATGARTLAARGLAYLVYNTGTEAIISGSGVT